MPTSTKPHNEPRIAQGINQDEITEARKAAENAVWYLKLIENNQITESVARTMGDAKASLNKAKRHISACLMPANSSE